MNAPTVSRRTAICLSTVAVAALATVACQPEEATASQSALQAAIEAHREEMAAKSEASKIEAALQLALDATLEDNPIIYDTFVGPLTLYGIDEWLMSDFDHIATDRCLIDARKERLTAIDRKFKEHNSGGGWIDHRAERAEREEVNGDYFAARTARDRAIAEYRQRGADMGMEAASQSYDAAASSEYEAANAVLMAPCVTTHEAAAKASYIAQHRENFHWIIEEMNGDELSAFLSSFGGGRAEV